MALYALNDFQWPFVHRRNIYENGNGIAGFRVEGAEMAVQVDANMKLFCDGNFMTSLTLITSIKSQTLAC